jgi:hypothetical protein
LWAHFCALVEEERGHGADEPAAARAALERLGDADEIRAAFMASLPRSERWVARWERRPAETSMHYARRLLLGFLPLLALIPLGIGVQISLAAPKTPTLVISIAATLCLWLPAFLALALVNTPRWEALLRRHDSTLPFIRRYALDAWISAAMTALFLLLGFACMVAWLGADDLLALSYLYLAAPILALQWLTMTAVFFYALVRGKQHAQLIPGWPYLPS